MSRLDPHGLWACTWLARLARSRVIGARRALLPALVPLLLVIAACRTGPATPVPSPEASATAARDLSTGAAGVSTAAGRVATPTASSATPTPALVCIVRADRTNLRDGPGMGSRVIGGLVRGDEFAPQERTADSSWLLGTGPRDRGWVAASLLDCPGDLTALITSDREVQVALAAPTPTLLRAPTLIATPTAVTPTAPTPEATDEDPTPCAGSILSCLRPPRSSADAQLAFMPPQGAGIVYWPLPAGEVSVPLPSPHGGDAGYSATDGLGVSAEGFGAGGVSIEASSIAEGHPLEPPRVVSYGNGTYRALITIGANAPRGRYLVTVTDRDSGIQATGVFTVSASPQPMIWVHESPPDPSRSHGPYEVYPPGTVLRVALSGYRPFSAAPLSIYRIVEYDPAQGELGVCWSAWSGAGLRLHEGVEIGPEGEGEWAFGTVGSDPAGDYIVVAEPMIEWYGSVPWRRDPDTGEVICDSPLDDRYNLVFWGGRFALHP